MGETTTTTPLPLPPVPTETTITTLLLLPAEKVRVDPMGTTITMPLLLPAVLTETMRAARRRHQTPMCRMIATGNLRLVAAVERREALLMRRLSRCGTTLTILRRIS